MLLFFAQCSAGISPCHPSQAPRLLGEVLEEVAVLLDALDREPAGREVVPIPVAAEAGRKVKRGKVGQAAEGRGEDQPPARTQQPRELPERSDRIRKMLKDLRA